MDPDVRIAELQRKLEIELKCKEGGEAMLAKLTDKNALAQCHASLNNANQRIEFLNSEIERLSFSNHYKSAPSLPTPSLEQSSSRSNSTPPLPLESALDNPANLDPSQDLGSKSSFISYFRKVIPHRPRTSGSSLEIQRVSTSQSASSKESLGEPSLEHPLPVRMDSIPIHKLIHQGPEFPGTVIPVNDTNVELSRSGVGLSNAKISNKLRDLTYKLDIDLKYKKASGKIDALLQSDPSSRHMQQDVVKAQFECQARIDALKASIQKYNSLFVPDTVDEPSPNPPISAGSNTSLSGPSKKGDTGTFVIYLSMARIPPSVKNPMSRVHVRYYQAMIRIDGLTKVKSKLIKFPKDRTGVDTVLSFNEEHEIVVTKAMEVEVVISEVDKSEQIHAIVGLFWFRLRDLNPFLTIGWFDLDPAGSLLMQAKFNPHTLDNRKKLSKLGRQGAVLRKKKIEYTTNGHSFVLHSFSTIMKCSLCTEFIGMASCYVCASCQFACHKKCAYRVLTNCISHAAKPEEIMVPAALHRIPHRFQPSQQLTVNWCCWCGHMLPLGRGYLKCTDCDHTAHEACSVLVPNFCGMTMKRANLMLQEIRLANSMKSKTSSSEKLLGHSALSASHPFKSEKGLVDQSGPKFMETNFDYISVLGRGNFGKVMLAEEKSTKKLYAIKILKKNFVLENGEVESTLSEKRIFLIANQSKHPFLLNLHACFQSETRLFFVMEYVAGGDLMLHIQQQQFSEQRARFYACEVLLALEFFHQNNIIYRDLKLDNIMLDLDGHIKLADYGLCKENVGYNMTTNTFCGTPEFMAPEILYEQHYTRAVDWWAFGVLIYEMICGQSPFRGEDEDDIFESILHDEVLYPITMSRDAVSLCQMLLTKDPQARLGRGPNDALEIKRHPFFKGVDWDMILARKVIPPFVPRVSNGRDVSNFDEEFTSEKPSLTPMPSVLEDIEQREFDGFSFSGEFPE